MRIFISGGCKNGKSYYAQRLSKAQQDGSLYYVATMASVDSEDDERIIRHQNERDGWGFITVEQPVNIEEILLKCEHDGSFLLDSLTALLANEMFASDGSIDYDAAPRIIVALKKIAFNIDNIIFVSDYLYSDAMIYDELTDLYRKSLAQIDRAVAEMCEAVIEISFTNVIIHRAPEDLEL